MAHIARLHPQRPGPRHHARRLGGGAVELRRAVRRQRARRLGARRSTPAAPAGAASRSRCSTPASPTPSAAATAARPTCAGTHFVRGYDFVAHDPYPNDHNGHGTHVASHDRRGDQQRRSALTGLAYGATIMPVRVLDDHGEGDARDIAAGVRFAVRHGAQVINLSLEFSTDVTASRDPRARRRARLRAPQGRARRRRVGQRGRTTRSPIPARASYVVSVGATTEHGCLADYSNQGSGPRPRRARAAAPTRCVDGDPNCHPADPAGPRHLPDDARGRPEEPPLRPPGRLRGHVDGRAARGRRPRRW